MKTSPSTTFALPAQTDTYMTIIIRTCFEQTTTAYMYSAGFRFKSFYGPKKRLITYQLFCICTTNTVSL